MSDNPFEAPQSLELRTREPPRGQYRDGKILVHPIGARFDDRCLKCGARPDGRHLERKLYWHSPWIYLLLFQLLIYAIVALSVRKKVIIKIPLCHEHRMRRRNGMITGTAVMFASLGLAFVGDPGVTVPLAIFGILAGAIVLIVCERVVTAQRIDPRQVRIAGAGEAYLAPLPTYSRSMG